MVIPIQVLAAKTQYCEKPSPDTQGLNQHSENVHWCTELWAAYDLNIYQDERKGKNTGCEGNPAQFFYSLHNALVSKDQVTENKEQQISYDVPTAISITPDTLRVYENVHQSYGYYQQWQQCSGIVHETGQPCDNALAFFSGNHEQRYCNY